MKKQKLLFVINQFFKGGAETALLNLFNILDPDRYDVDFLVLDQIALKNTVSLLPQVPRWIHVIDAARGEGVFAFVKKLCFLLLRRLTHRQPFRRAAVKYVRQNRYDIAISFGEWFSPALVAREVTAARKYVWVHSDLDKAPFVHPDLLSCHRLIDAFVFVSEPSRTAALQQYPMLADRSRIVCNAVDKAALLEKSSVPSPVSIPHDGLPVLLTVANIRPEKNHLRQVRVMAQLQKQGIFFHWVNIGSTANLELVHQIKKEIADAGLQKYFHLTGATENPYPAIKAADAVCVLSDHESWSMVITEAKTLGVPVIATKTSGALAQVRDGETGLLCDFSETDIAEKISGFLADAPLRQSLRRNLSGFSPAEETLAQLQPLLDDCGRKVLFVFDDINYRSGARAAALQQAAALKAHCRVVLFSGEPCTDAALQQAYPMADMGDNKVFRCLSAPIRSVFADEKNGWRIKLLRVAYAVGVRLGLERHFLNLLLRREIRGFMEGFDAVCVVSEASKFRWLVSRLRRPRKLQWIHTDYAAWRQQTPWTRAITRKDGSLYRRYDHILCLSPQLQQRFCQCYPHLAAKAVALPNLVDDARIRAGAAEPCGITPDADLCNLITVGRMEREKRFDRILELAALLKRQGVRFHWYLVGDGGLSESLAAQVAAMDLQDVMTLTGALANPYPLMARCDLFVLLSDYEGTPVTVDEAKVLGLPVLATNVGGIEDMLENGKYGTVVPASFSAAAFADLIQKTRTAPAIPSALCEQQNLLQKQTFTHLLTS